MLWKLGLKCVYSSSDARTSWKPMRKMPASITRWLSQASGGPTSGNELRDVYAQFLPAKYNEASELIVQIDPTQGDVEQNFELKSN